MVFLDASAIVAMLTDEVEGNHLADRLAEYSDRTTSGVAIYEAVNAVARKQGWTLAEARGLVEEFLLSADVAVVPIGEAESRMALEAASRFGKGRHPAKLDMGDCFAYACARTHGASILFKGDGFGLTDLQSA